MTRRDFLYGRPVGVAGFLAGGVGMASIEAKSGGGYAVRWREGRTGRQQTCATRREAERVKRGVEEALALGRRWDPRVALTAPLVSDSAPKARDGAIYSYLKSLARRGLKDSSINQVRLSLDPWARWLTERLRRRPDLGDLSARVLEDYYDERLEEETTPRRAATNVRHVEAFWQWLATRDEYAAHTPAFRRTDLPSPDPKLQPYALTWAMVDHIIQVERDRPDTYGSKAWWRARVLTIQRYTGLRVSQAGRLLWSDLDLDRGLLTIRPELGKTRQEARGRVVPVSPHLLAEVAGWGVRQGFLAGCVSFNSLGFPRDFGRWRHIVENAGFTREQVPQPTHCIRRTFVAELTRARVPEAVVKLFVGHDPGLTAGTYADHDEALREQAVEALAHVPAIGAAGRVATLHKKEVG